MGETLDFFRGRLDSMIDLQHRLAVLGTRLPWAQIEAALTPIWQRPSREGALQQSLMADLFDLTRAVAVAVALLVPSWSEPA